MDLTDAALREQRDAALVLLQRLIRRGRALAEAADSSTPSRAAADVGVWQQDCAAAINELSGGSKAHWLSRAYSGALLVRSADGGPLVEANMAEIVGRILDVLEQAVRSLSDMDVAAIASFGTEPQPRRFDFVRNPQLRPVLEQAFVDGGRALDEGDFERALMTSCGIIEAIVTDALEVGLEVRLKPDTTGKGGPDTTGRGGPDTTEVRGWSFDQRIAAAERARLIRGGCARLPPVARAYRDARPPLTVSERDAKVASQVLRVVMRDLDPGR